MCLVLLTSCSLVWTVASVGAVMLLLASHLSPAWLLGHPVVLRHTAPPAIDTFDSDTVDITAWRGAVEVRPSLGVWLRCTIMAGKKGTANTQHCGVYATTGADLPTAQVIAMASLVTGTSIAVLATLLVLLSSCRRVLGKKSIFNIAGSMQALAGVFCILGLVIYPLSWSSVRVALMCGPLASEYCLGGCSAGWAMYSAALGTALLLVCSAASVRVDRSVSSNRAEEEIRRGNHFICVT